MIQINQPVILANKQVISFDEYRLSKDFEGRMQSEIRFLVRGDDGKLIRPIMIVLQGDAHNNFWNSFNTGASLYELLAQKEGLTFSSDSETEKEFVNS